MFYRSRLKIPSVIIDFKIILKELDQIIEVNVQRTIDELEEFYSEK